MTVLVLVLASTSVSVVPASTIIAPSTGYLRAMATAAARTYGHIHQIRERGVTDGHIYQIERGGYILDQKEGGLVREGIIRLEGKAFLLSLAFKG